MTHNAAHSIFNIPELQEKILSPSNFDHDDLKSILNLRKVSKSFDHLCWKNLRTLSVTSRATINNKNSNQPICLKRKPFLLCNVPVSMDALRNAFGPVTGRMFQVVSEKATELTGIYFLTSLPMELLVEILRVCSAFGTEKLSKIRSVAFKPSQENQGTVASILQLFLSRLKSLSFELPTHTTTLQLALLDTLMCCVNVTQLTLVNYNYTGRNNSSFYSPLYSVISFLPVLERIRCFCCIQAQNGSVCSCFRAKHSVSDGAWYIVDLLKKIWVKRRNNVDPANSGSEPIFALETTNLPLKFWFHSADFTLPLVSKLDLDIFITDNQRRLFGSRNYRFDSFFEGLPSLIQCSIRFLKRSEHGLSIDNLPPKRNLFFAWLITDFCRAYAEKPGPLHELNIFDGPYLATYESKPDPSLILHYVNCLVGELYGVKNTREYTSENPVVETKTLECVRYNAKAVTRFQTRV